MLLLSLFWVLLGLLIGALANAAKLRPAAWVRGGRLGMLGLGALVAVLRGWAVGAGHICDGDAWMRAGRGAPAPVDHVARPFPAHLTQAGGPAPRQGSAGLQAQVTHWRETQIRDLLPLCHAILAIDVLNRTDSACWSHSSNVLA